MQYKSFAKNFVPLQQKTTAPFKRGKNASPLNTLLLGTIFALINFIGGVLFPLWLRVILDLVNIILTLTLMIRGLHWEGENIDPQMEGSGWTIFWCSLIGGGILVIGSFFHEEFISTHSLFLLIAFAVWFYYDLRN